jgi:hypothetical protein
MSYHDIRVLIACEYSGVMRRAFRALGFDAWSCDLLPAEDGSPYHYQCDVREVLSQAWHVLIAHPVCTRLTLAGVRWLHERNLWDDLDAACDFFRLFLDAGHIPMRAIENPQPHRYAVQRIGRSYDQKVQPWQFGHPETKGVCWWLEGLPPLVPSQILPLDQRTPRVWRMPPGPDRAKERSRFFPPMADACADQWGRHAARALRGLAA